jgi:hypothetical protein
VPAEILEENIETVRLPKNWPSFVRNAMLNVIGMVRIAVLAGRETLITNGDTKDALKEILRLMTIPEAQTDFELEMRFAIDWYNEHRPHETLEGKTPNEVSFARSPANEQPRIEPRRKWPRGSPCAKPEVAIDGNPGDPIVLEIGNSQTSGSSYPARRTRSFHELASSLSMKRSDTGSNLNVSPTRSRYRVMLTK